MKTKRGSTQIFKPTPHEIRRACERIQEAWSDQERHKRSGRPKGQHWTPPLVSSEWLTSETTSMGEDASLS